MTSASTVRTVGVVGCGTMGSGIAETCARAGYAITVRVLDDEHRRAGEARIHASLDHALEGGKVTEAERDATIGRISFVTDLAALRGADLVIEAVPERVDAKLALFRELASACGPETALATNTSSLPVIEMAVASGRPERVVGLHFFNPAPVMRLVELAETVATSSETRDVAKGFAESLGKTVVVCRDRAGFIANLLLFPYLNEAVKLLDGGYAGVEDIDTAMKLGAGHPMGPMELVDLVGLDACMQILEALHAAFAEPRYAPSPAFRQRVVAGFTGRKAGRGFYAYPDRHGKPERAPGRAEQLPPPEREVKRLGVAGTGTVAVGIVEVAARAGLEVVCWGRSEESAGRAVTAVERSTEKAVDKGKLSDEDRAALLERVETVTELTGLSTCDLVVEAVTEDLDVKRELFGRLGGALPEEVILASATSSLPVIDLAAAAGRPERVVGLHVFNPVPIMKLVEVVRTVASDEAVVATAVELCERLGKTPVVCGDRAGFIVNRLLFPYINDAARMVEEGYADAEDVDSVMTLGANHPIGPLALADLVGLDVTLEIVRSLHRDLVDPAYAPALLLEHMVRAGFLGRKSGRGFLEYSS